jgi:hypothetical protein
MFNPLEVVKRLLESFKRRFRGRSTSSVVSRLVSGFVFVHWTLAKAEVSNEAYPNAAPKSVIPIGVTEFNDRDLRCPPAASFRLDCQWL